MDAAGEYSRANRDNRHADRSGRENPRHRDALPSQDGANLTGGADARRERVGTSGNGCRAGGSVCLLADRRDPCATRDGCVANTATRRRPNSYRPGRASGRDNPSLAWGVDATCQNPRACPDRDGPNRCAGLLAG